MDMVFARGAVPAAGQRRSAAGAESAHRPDGGAIAGDLAGQHLDIGDIEAGERRRRRAAVPAAALAVAPDRPFGIAVGAETNVAAQALPVPGLAHPKASC